MERVDDPGRTPMPEGGPSATGGGTHPGRLLHIGCGFKDKAYLLILPA